MARKRHFPSDSKPMVMITLQGEGSHWNPRQDHDFFRPEESGLEGDSADASRILKVGPGRIRGRRGRDPCYSKVAMEDFGILEEI